MSRWKLFGKSKQEETPEPEETVTEEKTDETVETDQETKDKPLAEYHETLHSGSSASKKSSSSKKGATGSSDQRVWRDVDGIEDKVDNLHITRAQKPVSELDKTVDKLISKRKKK